jgi:carboxyl-terminal processing protease
VRGRARNLEEVTVPEKGIPPPYTFRLAILVNEKTASAAEIVAGALQDHDRALIVGLPTFGKGLVQSVYQLAQGAGVAITTAFYFTPSGRSIQRPLKDGQLGTGGKPLYGNLESASEFKTASGRTVKGGGAIEPDEAVSPPRITRLQAFLDASGVLTMYATDFLARKNTVSDGFAVSDRLIDELQVFLSERNVRPGLAEWSADREWIRSRVHQEILNQAVGVDKGDEVEMRRDPQVLRALELLLSGGQ